MRNCKTWLGFVVCMISLNCIHGLPKDETAVPAMVLATSALIPSNPVSNGEPAIPQLDVKESAIPNTNVAVEPVAAKVTPAIAANPIEPVAPVPVPQPAQTTLSQTPASKDLKEEQHDLPTQNNDSHSPAIAIVSNDASSPQAATKQPESVVLAQDSKALEAAKVDLQKKLSLVAKSAAQTDSKLETSVTSGASIASKLMMVSWYSEATCTGEVRTSSMLDASNVCQFLPGYQIPVVQSATVECSQNNQRGIATFFDTSCEAHNNSIVGRSLTVTLHEANCLKFPGEDYYAKVDWCRDAEDSASSILQFSTVALISIAVAIQMHWHL